MRRLVIEHVGHSAVHGMTTATGPLRRLDIPSTRGLVLVSGISGALAVGCGLLVSSSLKWTFVLAFLPLAGALLPWYIRYLVPSVRNQLILASLALLVTAAPWTSPEATAVGVTNLHTGLTKAKLVVWGLAVGLAVIRGRFRHMASGIVTLLLAYACVTLLGGALLGDTSSVARSLRFAVVVLAVAAIAGRLPRGDIVRLTIGFAVTVSASSLAGALVGGARLYHRRLQGYPLPLHPNLLGFIAALGILLAAALWSERGLSSKHIITVVAVLAPALVLSGSRTSIAALVLGLAGLRIRATGARSTALVGVLVALAAVVIVLQIGTSYKPLSSLSTRGGTTTVTGTIDTRTSEWSAAIDANRTPTEKVFGKGLAVKTLAVNLPFAESAPIDGTWYAAYLSAGLAGVVILAVLLASILSVAYRTMDRLLLSTALFVAVTSALTDVLNDVSIGLVVLVALAIGNELRRRRNTVAEVPLPSSATAGFPLIRPHGFGKV